MRWAENIRITGEVFSGYAFLSYKIEYSGKEGFGADSIFRLPPNSVLSGFKLFQGGRLVEPELVTASWSATIKGASEKPFASLLKLKNDEYLLSVDSTENTTVLFNMYVKLSANRIILPFSRSEHKERISTLSVDLKIMPRCELYSPSHEICVSNEGDYSRITLDCSGALRDFCIEINEKEKVSHGISTEEPLGGEMLCCLYPKTKSKYTPQKLLIVLDGYTPDNAMFFAVKDMAYCLARNCGIKYSVVCRDEADGDFDFFENKGDGLVDFLSNIKVTSEKTEVVTPVCEDDCLKVLVSANPDIDVKSNPNIITVGDRAVSENMHVFPYDDMEKMARKSLEILLNGKNFVKLNAEYGDATVLSYDGELFAYVKYSGDIPPKKFTVTIGDKKEEIYLSDIRVYRSFSPIGLIKGKLVCDELYKKLVVCKDYEVWEIRKQLEDAGVKYSILNSETALICELEGKKAKIKTIFPTYQTGRVPSEFDKRPLMFREIDEPPSQKFADICRYVLIKSMRSDGSVCSDGETEYRKKQTLVSVIALVAYKKPSKEFLKKAENFLSGFSYNGAEYTEDEDTAFLYLEKFIMKDSYIPDDSIPDLLGAATVLHQVIEIRKRERHG